MALFSRTAALPSPQQALPGRAEFGGVVTNLQHELTLTGVEIRTRTEIDARQVSSTGPDAVLIATGARNRLPEDD